MKGRQRFDHGIVRPPRQGGEWDRGYGLSVRDHRRWTGRALPGTGGKQQGSHATDKGTPIPCPPAPRYPGPRYPELWAGLRARPRKTHPQRPERPVYPPDDTTQTTGGRRGPPLTRTEHLWQPAPNSAIRRPRDVKTSNRLFAQPIRWDLHQQSAPLSRVLP